MSKYAYKLNRRKFLRTSAVVSTGIGLSFHSLGANQQSKIRFGLVTDSHYADRDPANTRYYRQSLIKMEDFIQEMNGKKPDFIIHLGDFKDQDSHEKEDDTLKYLSKLENIYSKFNGPRYHCVGNHDVDSITKQQFLGNITNTGIANDQSYYSFNYQRYHFVVLDANYHQNGRDHFYKEGADWQDTTIPEEQIAWLRKDLSDTQHPTLIFCHHPLFEYYHGESKMHVNNYQNIQGILETSGKVIAVLHGHVHEERYKRINGIHYVTQNGMVDYSGPENNSYALIELEEHGISILGYKRASTKDLG